MTDIAYTVGRTTAYEKYLSEDSEPGKGVGGVAFRTREEAQALLDANGGCLPEAWYGPGLHASVYGIELPGDFEQVTSRDVPTVRSAYHVWNEHASPPAECSDCEQNFYGKPSQLDHAALLAPARLFKLDPT